MNYALNMINQPTKPISQPESVGQPEVSDGGGDVDGVSGSGDGGVNIGGDGIGGDVVSGVSDGSNGGVDGVGSVGSVSGEVASGQTDTKRRKAPPKCSNCGSTAHKAPKCNSN